MVSATSFLSSFHSPVSVMSSFSSTSILAAVALFSLITVSLPDGTTAIKCYQCTSKADPVCGQDDLPKSPDASHKAHRYLIDCNTLDGSHRDNTVSPNEKYTFCRKQVQDVEGNINIVRGCGLVKGDRACYSTANPPTKTEVCQCFEDGCNGATATMSSLVMTIISALVFFVAFNNNRGN